MGDAVRIAPLAAIEAAADALAELTFDELTDDDLRVVARVCEAASRRLAATRTMAASALATRRMRQAAAERPGDGRAGQRARKDVQRELADELRLSPQQASGALRTGRNLEQLDRVRAAFQAGEITDRHVDRIADTLAVFHGDRRDRVEADLLDQARRQDPVTFGRTCNRLLAEQAPDEAMARLDRQYARRRASLSTTPDGTVRLFAEGPGVDAEILATAIDAFRRPDGTGEHRTPEQRTWDALVDLASASLRAGEAPTRHGVRPHVSVVIADQTIRDRRGAGQAQFTGPLPYDELKRLLGDATLSAILANADFLPLEVSGEVRTVPAALWRALVIRDQQCLWPGCDLPARWCDVAHLIVPYRDHGRLTPLTAGLLCRRHHRIYDRQGYRTEFVDGRPRLLRPDGQPLERPRASSGRHPPPTTASEEHADYTAAESKRERRSVTVALPRRATGRLRPARSRPPARRRPRRLPPCRRATEAGDAD